MNWDSAMLVWNLVIEPRLREYGVPPEHRVLAVNPCWSGDADRSVVDALIAHATSIAETHGRT